MFKDLNQSLQNLLNVTAVTGAGCEFTFDAPNQTFAGGTFTQATLNLFLYEISENRVLRNRAPTTSAPVGGKISIAPPPLRVDCSYLVTAWTPQGTTDPTSAQLELLGNAFIRLCSVPLIDPADPTLGPYLVGSLQTTPYPIRLLTAQPDEHRSAREVWTALGIPMRSSFHLIVTIAAPPVAPVVATQVTTVQVEFSDLSSPTPNTPIVTVPPT